MPHFKEPWCSGVDFVYDIDYRSLLEREINAEIDIAAVRADKLAEADAVPADDGALRGPLARTERVLSLTGDAAGGDPLQWIPLEGFERRRWAESPFPRRVHGVLQAKPGLALDGEQMRIVKDCMSSLATSKD